MKVILPLSECPISSPTGMVPNYTANPVHNIPSKFALIHEIIRNDCKARRGQQGLSVGQRN